MKRMLTCAALAVLTIPAPALAQQPELEEPETDIGALTDQIRLADDALLITAYILATTSTDPLYEMDKTLLNNAASALQMKPWELIFHFVDHDWDSPEDRRDSVTALAPRRLRPCNDR